MGFTAEVPHRKIGEGKYVIRFEDWVKCYFDITLQATRDRMSEEEYKKWYDELWGQFEIWAAFLSGYQDIAITLKE